MHTASHDQATLLVVDDQPLNLLVLQSIFRPHYRVLIADNGYDALRLSREERPDLVLLDVLMPGIDGLEVCRRLKDSEQTRDIPIIFVTSQGDPEEETRALGAGAVDFISKPINASVVQARVNTHLTLKRQSDFLRSQVFVDSLTGLYNRRRLEESLQYEWLRGLRHQTSLALLVIDVDNFKAINDTWGHQVGDEVLVGIARVLRSTLNRSQDLVARFGGEEFVCLIPDSDLVQAQSQARLLVQAVAREALAPSAARPSSVTISVGFAVATPGPQGSPEQLFAAADRLLYQAKAQGKNRAVGQLLVAKAAHDVRLQA